MAEWRLKVNKKIPLEERRKNAGGYFSEAKPTVLHSYQRRTFQINFLRHERASPQRIVVRNISRLRQFSVFWCQKKKIALSPSNSCPARLRKSSTVSVIPFRNRKQEAETDLGGGSDSAAPRGHPL